MRRSLAAVALAAGALLLAPPAGSAAGGGGPPSVAELRRTCPAEVGACEAEAACKAEFRASFQRDAPPPSEQPSDLLMGVIRCFNANVEGHPPLPADSCPVETAACESTRNPDHTSHG